MHDLELPQELGPDTGTVHLNAVFANHTRDELLAMCHAMPIEKLDFCCPTSSDLMNRAVSVSLLMVRYLATKDRPQEYGDVLIPRFIERLEHHDPEKIHQQFALQLEQLGGELASAGREREALRCFIVFSKTLFGRAVAPRIASYVFAMRYNIALKTGAREDIEATLQLFDSLAPSQREQFSQAIPKLKSLLSNLRDPVAPAVPDGGGAKVKAELISVIQELRDKNVPDAEAATQLKARGQFDLNLLKEIILDETVQIWTRQRAMFVGAASGDAKFIMFLAKEFVLNQSPKVSLGMFSDAKDICEQHGMRFQ